MTDMHMYVHVHTEQIKCDKHVKTLISKPYVHIHTEQMKYDKHVKILIPKPVTTEPTIRYSSLDPQRNFYFQTAYLLHFPLSTAIFL